MKKIRMEEVKKSVNPEFLNRIDEIVIFRKLGAEELSGIIDIQLTKVLDRLSEKKYTLELDKKVKYLIAKDGYNPAYGARPLKRSIQKKLLDPLASEIISGTFKEGSAIKASVERKGAEEIIVFKGSDPN